MLPEADDGVLEKGDPVGDSLAQPDAIREDFPETWIFSEVVISVDGQAVIKANVPDTITSWVASAFAVSSVMGLGIAEPPAMITVFKPFFISLNLPYSVIRGEEVVLQIIVFNYMATDQAVKLTLAQSSMFKVRRMDESSATSQELVENLTVPSNDGTSFKVWIIPQALGDIPIHVKAQTTQAADELKQTLLVEAEGEEHQESDSAFITLEEGSNAQFVNTFNIQYPTDGLVEDTKRIVVTAMGNPLSSMLTNLEKLIQAPYGCGEQNMVTFTPNIEALMYLKATGQDNPEIRNRALKNILSGYQRELTYQRMDKSFSAFGDSDEAGSVWLSAFVIRSFNRARQFLGANLDQQVLDEAMGYIINRQTSTGAFEEPKGGRVIHTEMQGGASKGVPLTAYVLIALLENFEDRPNNADSLTSQLRDAIDKATRRLIGEIENVKTDAYAMALMTYALTLAGDDNADAALGYLNDLAIEKGGIKYWEKDETTTCERYWCPTPSYNIEMTSYAVLIYVKKGDVAGSLPMAKYLISKRNSLGGYGSTQDTLLALHALTSFTIISGSSSNQNVQVTVRAGSDVHSFEPITQDNALLVQSVELPNPDVSTVQVTATGTGVAVIQITVYYHQTVTATSKVIDVVVSSDQTTNNVIEINTCARWLDSSSDSGMVLVEIQQLTGYIPDTKDVMKRNEGKGLKRVEVKEGALNLYLDQVTSEELCIVTTSMSGAEVANMQPRTVKVSSYYKPEISDVEFYPLTADFSVSPIDLFTDPGTTTDAVDPEGDAGAAVALVAGPIVLLTGFLAFLLK
jgi:CD109 antigen